MKNKHTIKEFKEDLKQLLIKHKAELFFNIGGDTHGIYNEGFSVLKEGKEYILNRNNYLDVSDL